MDSLCVCSKKSVSMFQIHMWSKIYTISKSVSIQVGRHREVCHQLLIKSMSPFPPTAEEVINYTNTMANEDRVVDTREGKWKVRGIVRTSRKGHQRTWEDMKWKQLRVSGKFCDFAVSRSFASSSTYSSSSVVSQWSYQFKPCSMLCVCVIEVFPCTSEN